MLSATPNNKHCKLVLYLEHKGLSVGNVHSPRIIEPEVLFQ